MMDIYCEEGTKIRYIATGGYDSEVPEANKYLEKDEIYTVDYVDIGGFISYVHLKEFPDRDFNTVMFEEV